MKQILLAMAATGLCAAALPPTAAHAQDDSSKLPGAASTTNAFAFVVPTRSYQTKTPYQPFGDMARYEPAPAGYRPVYTEMLSRHGSRGLTGFKADLALYRLWQQAEKEHALTPLGARLGPDIVTLMHANFVLGYGVDGIRKPGYGNETQQGIAEHKDLAQRMVRRLPELFNSMDPARKIVVVTSGKDRAVDSSHFFVQSLLAAQPGLTQSLIYPPSLAPREETDHTDRPVGTDRFMLYFHKLGSNHDMVTDATDPLYVTYQQSQAYQAYLQSDDLRAKERAILAQPRVAAASLAVLQRLFKPSFVARLQHGGASYANTGSETFSSADGKFSSTLTGDGSERIATPTDAARALYELYGAAADMRAEVAADFTVYMPPEQAAVFAYVNDAGDFYKKGPGISERDGVTYKMAQTLKDDFIAEVSAVAGGDLSHAAKLRFTHAEAIIPLAALLGIPAMAQPLPRATLYQYENDPWRGEAVALMTANLQWDVYVDGRGQTALRMLYNERETDFKPACDAARVGPASHFYDFQRLKACLG